MLVLLFPLLVHLLQPLHAAPLAQSQLTLSEFRAEGRRSLGPPSNSVIISPSYRQVRRQGRKGESLPIKFPTLKVRHPNELQPANIKTEVIEEDSQPVFDNKNRITTEDIESKIKEINASFETEVPKLKGDLEVSEAIEESQEPYEATTELVEESTTQTATLKEINDSKETSVNHVVIAINTEIINDSLSKDEIEEELRKITMHDITVFINELDSTIQNDFSDPESIIYVDAKVNTDRKISGNVFHSGRPLETLEEDDYEEALAILNKVSEIVENSLAFEITTVPVNESKKKIIVAIRSAQTVEEKILDDIRDSLEEADTDTVVLVNAPEEVVRSEFDDTDFPVFVSFAINPDSEVSGNIYYNSIPLENLGSPEAQEASEVLITVKNILEENIKQSSPSELITEKIVISLKSSIDLNADDINELISEISHKVGSLTVLLVNRPTQEVQSILATLQSNEIPILLDMRVDDEYKISGNIFYNFQPIENLSGEQLDKAFKILTVVREEITKKIDTTLQYLALGGTEVTENSIEETTQEINLSTLVYTKILPTEAATEELEEIEEATPEPEPEPVAEPEPAPIEELSVVEEIQETTNEAVELEKTDVFVDTAELELNNEFLVEDGTDPIDGAEGSGFVSNAVETFEVVSNSPEVVVEVLNRGFKGVTEPPGGTNVATPGVDFGTIQEIVTF